MANENFDFNLIKVFCSIYETQSLTETADALSITQPAVSYALKKLRDSYNDPLFIRAEGKMIATSLANKIAPTLKNSKEMIQKSFYGVYDFDPRLSSRVFKFSMSDVSQIFFLPPICFALEKYSPRISIETLQIEQNNIEFNLHKGELDFAIGNLANQEEKFKNILIDKIFEDRFVCMVREDHPAGVDESNNFDLGRIKILSVRNNITDHCNQIKKMSSELHKNITLVVPNYAATPIIVSKSDYGVIIPLSIAKIYNHDNQFEIYEIDYPNNSIDVNLYSHVSYQEDPSIKWMRNLILKNFHHHNV